jgi:hypothetical protein
MPVAQLLSPLLWQSVPFHDPDSWDDFAFQHEQWHRELARTLKLPFPTLDDLRGNLEPHAQAHQALAAALNLSQVNDLASADLDDETAFVGWMQLNALEHQRLRQAAGL